MNSNALSYDRMGELLNYCQDSGVFTWKIDRNRCKKGSEAGSRHVKGYRAIMIDGRMYLSHRLAWLFMHKSWPKGQIDHADGVLTNNAISNLRDCSPAENKQNLKTYSTKKGKTSQFPGVYWAKKNHKWHARINCDKNRTHLGYFENEEDAYSAYLRAKQEIHWFQPVPREVMA